MDNPQGLEVRVATPADLDEIMQLALAACDENAFLDANPAKLAAEIWPALNRDHGICAVIGKPNGAIEGVVVLRIGNMWYSDASIIEEKAVFIHPDFRSAKGGRAKQLCEYSKKVSDTLGMPLIIGVLSNTRTAGKMRMYERLFGPPAGGFFLYGAHTGQHSRTEH